MTLKERAKIEVLSLLEAANFEKTKPYVESALKKVREGKVELREDYYTFAFYFDKLLKKERSWLVNPVGLIFGPFWAAYRNRWIGAFALLTFSNLLGLVLLGLVVLFKEVIINSVVLSVLVFLTAVVVQFIPFIYFGLFGYSYLAVTMEKGLPAEKNWKSLILYTALAFLEGFLLKSFF